VPIDISFSWEQWLVHLTMHGEIDGAAFLAAIAQVAVDSRLQADMHFLFDLRAATLSLSGADCEAVALRMGRIAHWLHRTAFVVSTDYAYGLSRMAGIYKELANNPTDFRIFRDLDEAAAWLKAD
jgi:hypothetical protein